MQLIYLYVEKYKNIKEQGFNFSSRFSCHYDKDKKELTIEENKNYIENFFGENIEVTAIVGENGAGKSNILDLLYSGTSPASDFFYIAIVKNELVVKGLEIIEQPTEDITNNKIKLKVFESKNSVTFHADGLTGCIALRNNNFSLIYYSNKFSAANDINARCIAGSSDSYKFNLSTSYLINKYTNIMLEMKNSKGVKHCSFESQYNLFISECIQQTLIMLQDEGIKLPFESPSKIYIHSFVNELKDPSNKYLSRIERNKLDFMGAVKYGLLANFLDYKITNYPYIDMLYSKINTKDLESIDFIYTEFSEVFLQEHFHTEENQSIQINPYIDDFKETDRLLTFLNENVSKITHGVMALDIKSIDVAIIKIYQRLVFVGMGFLRFDWHPNLSTGQENFLYQLANLYSLKNIIPSNRKFNKNLMIFIDEGENTFHPNWQKNYFNDLVYFFKKNFIQTSDIANVQFFFATHSPFILSDIPNQNIVFLKGGKQVNAFDKKNTFGANIHTLLSDGFFMQNGLMGEFAKNKIEEVVKDLNSSDPLSKDNLKNIEQVISIIGEPILKRELQRMLDSKRLNKMDKIDDLENQIELLKKRVDILRKRND